ncbi:uncharacterized protein LOC118436674 [Folsomia candida]|uniref:uncharacterized protein LOC118436674 n=1 Tax=Folsomia candida TaxID=158441 RepID=UPI001604E8B8|nr:uncharacterized protein LOC118436674 [Folsomia candida]
MKVKKPLILVSIFASSLLILSIPFWIFDTDNNTPIVPRCDLNSFVQSETEKSNQTGENLDYPEFLRVYGRLTKFFNKTGNHANFSNFNELIPYLVYNATFYDVMPLSAIVFYLQCINNSKEEGIFSVKMDELYPEFFPLLYNNPKLRENGTFKYYRSIAKRGDLYFLLLVVNSSVQVVFGTIIAITYLLLWERHSLHGHLQLCYVLSEAGYRTGKLIQLIFLVKSGARNSTYNVKYLEHCAKIDALSDYTSLSRHVWLTVLVFHLWKAFGRGITLPKNGKSKFGKYFAFALLSPAVFTCAKFMLQILLWGYDCNGLERNESTFTILHNTRSILLFACNLFFVLCCYRKSKVMQKEGEFAQENVICKRDGSSRLRLYIKLLLVLFGFQFCLPLISEVLDMVNLSPGRDETYVSLILNNVAICHSFFLFFVLIRHRQTKVGLKQVVVLEKGNLTKSADLLFESVLSGKVALIILQHVKCAWYLVKIRIVFAFLKLTIVCRKITCKERLC